MSNVELKISYLKKDQLKGLKLSKPDQQRLFTKVIHFYCYNEPFFLSRYFSVNPVFVTVNEKKIVLSVEDTVVTGSVFMSLSLYVIYLFHLKFFVHWCVSINNDWFMKMTACVWIKKLYWSLFFLCFQISLGSGTYHTARLPTHTATSGFPPNTYKLLLITVNIMSLC